MKPFQFRMQKILDAREMQKTEAEQELGKVVSQIQKVKQQLEEVAAQKIHTMKSSDSSMDFNTIIIGQKYLLGLENKKNQLLNQMAQLELEAEEKRKVVEEAMKRVNVLENLKEKQHQQWLKEKAKNDAAINDDIVNAMTARKLREDN